MVLDLNIHISEYKVATCDIRTGPRPCGPAPRELVEGYRRRMTLCGFVRARRMNLYTGAEQIGCG